MKSKNVDDPSYLMHEIINHISTIISIAQLSLISKEMSPEVQADMKRIIQTVRQMSDNLKQLAELLEED